MTLLVLFLGVANVAVIAYLLRYSGRLQASETCLMDASPAAVYARLVDFRQWGSWSPWLEHEPEANVTISEPADAVGASYSWRGRKIGACALKHLRLVPNAILEQQLTGIEPFEYRVKLVWSLVERDGKTELTVRFSGRVPMAKRLYARTIQGMLSLDLRYGMNKLARLSELTSEAHYVIEHLGLRSVSALSYTHSTYSGAITGVASAVGKGLAEVRQKLAELGVAPAGPALCVYARTNVKARATVCHMGYPIDPADVARHQGALPLRQLPAQDAYVVMLKGPRTALEVTWYQAMLRMRANGLEMSQTVPPFERYLDDGSVSEREQITELYIPVAVSKEGAQTAQA